MIFKEALAYDDVLLVPQYSNIESRSEVDIGNDLDNNIHLDLPIISSPMDTITEKDMARAIYEQGGLGIIHRYNTIKEQSCLVVDALANGVCNIGAAVGVSDDFKGRARALFDAGAKVICIDVAHGHHVLVERAIKKLKDMFGDSIHIMAGNIATPEAFEDLAKWGANSIRCNVGGGSICSTRIQTGHGVPGLHTIFECATVKKDENVKIIADGGIKNSGDIVKALAAGADFVMLGSMLAGTEETPGPLFESSSGDRYKTYRGMASKEAQINWRGNFSSDEGISTQVPYKGSVHTILTDIKNGIASGLSYSGARNIEELQAWSCFIKQTGAGQHESQTHILLK